MKRKLVLLHNEKDISSIGNQLFNTIGKALYGKKRKSDLLQSQVDVITKSFSVLTLTNYQKVKEKLDYDKYVFIAVGKECYEELGVSKFSQFPINKSGLFLVTIP